METLKTGDTVTIDQRDYDVVNDGKGLRARQVMAVTKTFGKDGLLKRKENIIAELAEIETLLTKCDELSVTGQQE